MCGLRWGCKVALHTLTRQGQRGFCFSILLGSCSRAPAPGPGLSRIIPEPVREVEVHAAGGSSLFHPLLVVARLQGKHGGRGDLGLWMRSGASQASDGGPAPGRFPMSPREPWLLPTRSALSSTGGCCPRLLYPLCPGPGSLCLWEPVMPWGGQVCVPRAPEFTSSIWFLDMYIYLHI